MPREATLPPRVVNVPGDYFSMAGFEVTLYGRFWLTPEVMRKLRFEHGSQGGTHKKGWYVRKSEVARLAVAYGLANRNLPESDTYYSNVTNVTEGHNVTQQEAPTHVGVEFDCFDDSNVV